MGEKSHVSTGPIIKKDGNCSMSRKEGQGIGGGKGLGVVRLRGEWRRGRTIWRVSETGAHRGHTRSRVLGACGL